MADSYDNDALREMCSKINLLEYASQSIEFERRGSSYAAHCPRHVDVTPSLIISPEENLFYCFSCGCGGNIINWLMIFEHMSFQDALKKISALSGIELKTLKQCDSMRVFKTIKASLQKIIPKKIERVILPEDSILQYDDETPDEWLSEGISADIMKKYDIRIDKKSNRIVYPVYDKSFNLIAFKGRTRYPDYKEMKIKKYLNYQKIGTTDFFIGMKENMNAIKTKNEAIIFEGIKSGMKVEAWGYDNWLSSETGHLNDDQIVILIQLGIKNVVIAYDNDVKVSKIIENTVKLRRFVNVYVVLDRRNVADRLLGEPADKLSPCDNGREVWEILYNERKKL